MEEKHQALALSQEDNKRARSLLIDMRAAMADGIEPTEELLQILIRTDDFAAKLYALGFAAGQAAGADVGIDETIEEYDRRMGWRKVGRPLTA